MSRLTGGSCGPRARSPFSQSSCELQCACCPARVLQTTYECERTAGAEERDLLQILPLFRSYARHSPSVHDFCPCLPKDQSQSAVQSKQRRKSSRDDFIAGSCFSWLSPAALQLITSESRDIPFATAAREMIESKNLMSRSQRRIHPNDGPRVVNEEMMCYALMP